MALPLLWAGRWFFTAPEPADRDADRAAAAALAQRTAASARAGAAAGTSAVVAAVPAAGNIATPNPAIPPGLTAEQWAALEAEWRARPDGASERQRVLAYLTWSDAMRRWRANPADVDLARSVDAGLPDRLALREVSAGEARQIKAALLATLEPDEARRTAALQAWDATVPAAAGPDARQRSFQKQQAALVAAWQARPVAERDPAALARQIEQLRRTHFSPVAAGVSAGVPARAAHQTPAAPSAAPPPNGR